MELTKEYFDQQISSINQRFDGVATKTDLQEQTKELKAYARERTEELAGIIANASLADRQLLEEKLDVRERVEKLEQGLQEIRGALHLSTS